MREDSMAAAGGRALSEAREALTRCHGESAHLHVSLIVQAEACTQHFSQNSRGKNILWLLRKASAFWSLGGAC